MRELDQVGVVDAALGEAQHAPGPGRIAPRAESRCTSALRSSAATRREAVLLGSSRQPRELAERGRALLLQHEDKQLRGALDGLGSARAEFGARLDSARGTHVSYRGI